MHSHVHGFLARLSKLTGCTFSSIEMALPTPARLRVDAFPGDRGRLVKDFVAGRWAPGDPNSVAIYYAANPRKFTAAHSDVAKCRIGQPCARFEVHLLLGNSLVALVYLNIRIRTTQELARIQVCL